MRISKLSVFIGPDTSYTQLVAYLCNSFSIDYAYVTAASSKERRITTIYDEPLIEPPAGEAPAGQLTIGLMVPDALVRHRIVDVALDSVRDLARIIISYHGLFGSRQRQAGHFAFSDNIDREAHRQLDADRRSDGYITESGVIVYRHQGILQYTTLPVVFRKLYRAIAGHVIYRNAMGRLAALSPTDAAEPTPVTA